MGKTHECVAEVEEHYCKRLENFCKRLVRNINQTKLQFWCKKTTKMGSLFNSRQDVVLKAKLELSWGGFGMNFPRIPEGRRCEAEFSEKFDSISNLQGAVLNLKMKESTIICYIILICKHSGGARV